ncbi:phage tail protein, partial [Escherichia coli]|uniref:phage tail protein n=1 Tax=Escherichia coli TaxID=562 RepID=UPI00398AB6A9
MMPFARYFCIFINVGLGEGSALPVGVPVPWPSATPPTGWLKCNGAAFSAEEGTVAKLAMRQPFVLFKGLTFQKLCLP